MLLWVCFGAVAILGVVMIAIRVIPVAPDAGPVPPKAQSVGDYPMPGGHYSVRPAPNLTAQDVIAVIAATPRTRQVAGETGAWPIVFHHRSAVWGFPDTTHIWMQDGNLHLFSHLIYGQADFGANRRRIEGWVAALSLS